MTRQGWLNVVAATIVVALGFAYFAFGTNAGRKGAIVSAIGGVLCLYPYARAELLKSMFDWMNSLVRPKSEKLKQLADAAANRKKNEISYIERGTQLGGFILLFVGIWIAFSAAD